jgi:hypothetical protein
VDGCCRAVGALAFSARRAGEDEQMRLGVGIPPPSSATHPAAISGCWDSMVLCSVFGQALSGKCFCCQERASPFIGGCFAAIVRWCMLSLVYALLPWFLSGCFAAIPAGCSSDLWVVALPPCMALSIVYVTIQLLSLGWCGQSISIFFLSSCSYMFISGRSSLSLCNEGPLIAMSCNLLCLQAIFPISKKEKKLQLC